MAVLDVPPQGPGPASRLLLAAPRNQLGGSEFPSASQKVWCLSWPLLVLKTSLALQLFVNEWASLRNWLMVGCNPARPGSGLLLAVDWLAQ